MDDLEILAAYEPDFQWEILGPGERFTVDPQLWEGDQA